MCRPRVLCMASGARSGSLWYRGVGVCSQPVGRAALEAPLAERRLLLTPRSFACAAWCQTAVPFPLLGAGAVPGCDLAARSQPSTAPSARGGVLRGLGCGAVLLEAVVFPWHRGDSVSCLWPLWGEASGQRLPKYSSSPPPHRARLDLSCCTSASCAFPSRPCSMAKSLTGTTTAASGSGRGSCPTQTSMASLSSAGRTRRKSRRPLKPEALQEVSRALLMSGAGTVLCLLRLLLQLLNGCVPTANGVRRIAVVSPLSRGRMLAV